MASASTASRDGTRAAARGLLAGGYLLSQETCADLQRVKLQDLVPLGRPQVVVLPRDDRPVARDLGSAFEKAGCETMVTPVPGYREMMVLPARSRVPAAALERIRASLVARASATGAEVGRPLLSDEAEDGGLRRRVVHLGSGDRLFGVVTEPSARDGEPPRAAVVLLAGGVVPRTAVNRMYVALANQLALRGHAVLRLDIAGIGESIPEEGAPHNDPYAPSLLGDVEVAMSWATRHTTSLGVELVGLCSGAYAAYQSALSDHRVMGVTLINPLVFYWTEAMTLDSPEVQPYPESIRHRLGSFRAASRWKLVLSPKAVLRTLRSLVDELTTTLDARGRRAVIGKPVPGDLEGDLRRILVRGAPVAVAFAEGDPGLNAFERRLPSGPAALRAAGLEVRIFGAADHTFSDLEVREALLDWIVGRVATRGTTEG